MSNHVVSVVIPCYNCEQTIEETIQSVLSQSYKSIELILVNDGSTDHTLQIIKGLISNKDNIILINQINQGQTKSRNTGAKRAKGTYLLFLDSDDKIESTFIKKCVNVLENDYKVGIVYSMAHFFGEIKGAWNLPEYEISTFLINNCIPITALIRKQDFFDANGFDESLTFYEDWELWLRFVISGKEIYRIPEILFFYRKHSNKTSLTDQAIKNKYIFSKNKLEIYYKHYDFYHKNLDSFENILNNYYTYKHKYYNQWHKKVFYKFKKILNKNRPK